MFITRIMYVVALVCVQQQLACYTEEWVDGQSKGDGRPRLESSITYLIDTYIHTDMYIEIDDDGEGKTACTSTQVPCVCMYACMSCPCVWCRATTNEYSSSWPSWWWRWSVMSVVCDRVCRAQLLKFWSKVMLWSSCWTFGVGLRWHVSTRHSEYSY